MGVSRLQKLLGLLESECLRHKESDQAPISGRDCRWIERDYQESSSKADI